MRKSPRNSTDSIQIKESQNTTKSSLSIDKLNSRNDSKQPTFL